MSVVLGSSIEEFAEEIKRDADNKEHIGKPIGDLWVIDISTHNKDMINYHIDTNLRLRGGIGGVLTIGYEYKNLLLKEEKHIRSDLPELSHSDRVKKLNTVIIVCGGPSLAVSVSRISNMDIPIIACNGAYKYLLGHGIIPWASICIDPLEDNLSFYERLEIEPNRPQRARGGDCNHETIHIVDIRCSPSIINRLYRAKSNIRLIDRFSPSESFSGDVLRALGPDGKEVQAIGCSVGMQAIITAFNMGYRNFELLGMDSCVTKGDNPKHHAYDQEWNDRWDIIHNVIIDGYSFDIQPWMIQQALEFGKLLSACGDEISVTIRGGGALKAIKNVYDRGANTAYVPSFGANAPDGQDVVANSLHPTAAPCLSGSNMEIY